MTKTWEEVEAETEAYRQTMQSKIDVLIYRCRRFITSPLRWPRNVKHWYQRISRGYADCDAWNGDAFLASNIAGILTWIVENGHGVSMSYWQEEDGDWWDCDVEAMLHRRNAEYLHYASIFTEYAKNGVAIDEEWQHNFGGVLESDMNDALQWLSKHFTSLWD